MGPIERASRIQAVVFDVDGVLTDGGLWYGPDGEALKRFDVKDGHAMVLARLTALPIAILTARTSKMVDVRAKELKLQHVFQGRIHKGDGLREVAAALNVTPEVCAYMGDDVNDLPAMALCGLAACPSDAVAEVKAAVHLVSSRPGGQGAARELIELVLRATGRWEQALSHLR